MRKRDLVPWVSLLLLWNALLLGVSGLVLYIVPPGRIAYWVGWRLLSLDKSSWEAVHTILGFCFVVLALLHLWLNWRPLKGYFKRRALALGGSLALTAVLFAGAAANIPPFSWIMDLGEKLSNSWAAGEPPVPHAERMSLRELSRYTGLSAEDMLKAIKEKGLKLPGENASFGEIARANGLSPAELWGRLNLKVKSAPKTGLGRKTLRQLAQELGVSLDEAIGTLREQGINVDPDRELRAYRDRVSPAEIYEILNNLVKSKP